MEEEKEKETVEEETVTITLDIKEMDEGDMEYSEYESGAKDKREYADEETKNDVWRVVRKKPRHINPYKEQYQLVIRNHVYVTYRALNGECCDWNPYYSRFLSKVPFNTPIKTQRQYYVYPGAQFFIHSPRITFSVDLHPKFSSILVSREVIMRHNLLHIPIREPRGEISDFKRGDILAYLYVSEKWNKRTSHDQLGPSLYCARCNDSGHEARNCREPKPCTAWERGRKRAGHVK